MTSTSDTIYALASASGKAGIAVIRVSGCDAVQVFERMIPNGKHTPRTTHKSNFYHPLSNELLDYGLYVYFPAPHSYTGEDCIEIHCHGGQATIASLLKALSLLPHFRHATPGEFSKRGFLHNKFDLTQAEAIVDLVQAETDHQRRSALAHSKGELYQLYFDWWQELLRLRAYTEACLDFTDEDLPENTEQTIFDDLTALHTAIFRHCGTAQRGERLKEGTQITIIGPSNAGKSSLLNHFTRQPTAITSPIAGTTRDSLSHYVDFAGFALKIIDTAGFQNSDDSIEKQGMERATQHALESDLVIIVVDGTAPPKDLAQIMEPHKHQPLFGVINKIDLLDSSSISSLASIQDIPTSSISLHTGAGIDVFHQNLQAMLKPLSGYDHTPIVTHVRYHESLQKSLRSLKILLDMIDTDNIDWIILAEELRLAQNALGQIIGKTDVEDILDVIFSRFCIGK